MAGSAFKYCDLVMKGGITSGIVYPFAALELSKQYRFKSIGGTSAGAIAAAACAAAAAGERRKVVGHAITPKPALVGFDGLAGVSRTLAREGFIFSLFQPASGAANAYRLIVLLAGNAGLLRKCLQAVLAVIAIAPLETFGLFALLCLGWWAAGYFSGFWAIALHAIPSFLGAYAVGAIFAALRVARVVRRNLLGLCSGMGPAASGGATPTLTDWLHQTLQNLSGQAGDEPLLFEHLWGAPRYPHEPHSDHAVSLTMITTDVSHSEPRSLPFDQDTHFWFTKREFDVLFPADVVDWMIRHSGEPRSFRGEAYHRLPAYGQLPVLVATRMSLSFPLLISAVPLHEIVHHGAAADGMELPAPRRSRPKTPLESADALAAGGAEQASGASAFRRCWFSDGGICSNFPIHLFDAPLPRWPTFAIDLVYPDASAARKNPGVFLPKPNDGWQPQYQPIASKFPIQEIAGFIFGIIATMQNWRDLLQSRAPGNRERIVHVPLSPQEGGMNLNMDAAILRQVSQKGTEAGQKFAEFSFDAHYWTRWRNLASAMQRYTIKVADSADYRPKINEYLAAYETARTTSPVPPYAFEGAVQREQARALLEGLIAQGHGWKDKGPDFTNTAPRPLPQMQITLTY
ncbi:patatin-like phospholipase family protein [Mesorhizobium sp.]|uniref:patatin-like phospholipase family protein n=1 Tax=Mesorhizobium sp. TaxID=1871066 RepID=UPI0025FD99AE|nr:patatin-like phospholipase family protein [Mesorhizobium sp.]